MLKQRKATDKMKSENLFEDTVQKKSKNKK